MLARVLITPVASLDLVEFGLYIAEDSPTDSERFLAKLEDAMGRLAEFPGMGQMRSELSPDLRSFPLGNYLIFYLRLNDGITVIRVLHGAGDIRRLFRRS
ncbi:MAG: type II toxin-antitoxin system RelE/ParE family toxin [Anaerolineae bacterium]|nr:type II toxin-antitoxin system RelE/ParE family toxin [Phycisphaerae bacterium]